MNGPSLTIAVINCRLKGYPEDCLQSLGVVCGRPDAEFILVTGSEQRELASSRFPRVRVIRLERGDRATAKNIALEKSRGKLILLTTADTVAGPGAVDRLQEFLHSFPEPAVASAQLLCENGLRRRTVYAFPSILREISPFHRSLRRLETALAKRRPARGEGPLPAEALHATFLMAPRRVFEQVGRFTEGYRFGYEDVEWCFRAAEKGIRRHVIPDALAFKVSPQLWGALPPSVRVAMEDSLYRLLEATHSPSYAVMSSRVRKFKSFWKWMLCGTLNKLLCGRSILLADGQAAYGAIWRMRRGDACTAPPDAESDVRWEYVV